jgi:nucleoside-diphosphate-sugar epimerase
MKPLIIVGCGYVGDRLARVALAEGRPVRVCARSTSRLAPLGALGAQVKYLDAAMTKQFAPALASLAGATVVYCVPPITGLPPGHAIGAALQAAYGGGADCFIHFSSSGLYGEGPDDDAWIDDETPIALDDHGMAAVRSDEAAVESHRFTRMRTVILRMAPVYGPGRGVRSRLRAGTYKLIDDGQHAISRIHVDDAVGAVLAAEARGEHGTKYLVADDQPTTQLEYATWLCERMGLPLPPSRPMFASGAPRVPHRNRRIRNTGIKQALGLTLKYPTFREGEAAIEAAEAQAS